MDPQNSVRVSQISSSTRTNRFRNENSGHGSLEYVFDVSTDVGSSERGSDGIGRGGLISESCNQIVLHLSYALLPRLCSHSVADCCRRKGERGNNFLARIRHRRNDVRTRTISFPALLLRARSHFGRHSVSWRLQRDWNRNINNSLTRTTISRIPKRSWIGTRYFIRLRWRLAPRRVTYRYPHSCRRPLQQSQIQSSTLLGITPYRSEIHSTSSPLHTPLQQSVHQPTHPSPIGYRPISLCHNLTTAIPFLEIRCPSSLLRWQLLLRWWVRSRLTARRE